MISETSDFWSGRRARVEATEKYKEADVQNISPTIIAGRAVVYVREARCISWQESIAKAGWDETSLCLVCDA